MVLNTEMGMAKGKASVGAFPQDWMGPGGVKLDEPIQLRDDVASWLAAKEVGLLTGIDPPRPGSPDYVPLVTLIER